MLDTDTAERLGYAAGDTITVVDAARARQRLTLVGLLDFGVSRQYSGLSVVGLPSSAVAALTGRDEFREIAVHTRDRVVPATVAAAVGPGHEVITGERWRDDLIDDAAGWLTPFRTFLLLFGLVSLFVAAFVIYNTFAVLGALRVRQTALLRCVGATRRQVFGATVLESAVIGLIGGALGTLLGIGSATPSSRCSTPRWTSGSRCGRRCSAWRRSRPASCWAGWSRWPRRSSRRSARPGPGRWPRCATSRPPRPGSGGSPYGPARPWSWAASGSPSPRSATATPTSRSA